MAVGAVSRREWLSRLAAILPVPVAAAPERVLINCLCVLVGLSVLISGGNPRLWTREFAVAWSVVMIAGGVATLVGFWRNIIDRPLAWANSLERVGCLALFLATVPYGLRLIYVYGILGIPVGSAFVLIGIAKIVRLLTSSAARDHVLRAGDDHPGEGDGQWTG